MAKNIKKFAGLTAIIFFIIALITFVLSVLDIITNDAMKETLLKSSYILGAVFIVSVIVYFVTKITKD